MGPSNLTPPFLGPVVFICSEDKLTVASVMADTIMEIVIHQLENSVNKLVSDKGNNNLNCVNVMCNWSERRRIW